MLSSEIYMWSIFPPTILVMRTLAAAVKLFQISRTKINEVLSQFCFSTWVLNYVELHPHKPHSLQRVHTSEIYWNLVFSNPVLEIGHSGISILYCKVLSFAQTVQNKSNLSFHREPWPQQNLRNRNLIGIVLSLMTIMFLLLAGNKSTTVLPQNSLETGKRQGLTDWQNMTS